MLIGVVGKTNVGKTTFFSAATLVEAERGNRPFVTIEPNEGVGFVRVASACTELGVRCEPKYGWCNGRHRYVPVKLLDVAGLVIGAHAGRGLGNKFLDDLRRATVNILVVDASGGTDDEGNPVPPGTHDPARDVEIVEEEFARWIAGIIRKNLDRVVRRVRAGSKPDEALSEVLSGLAIGRREVVKAAEAAGISLRSLDGVGEEDLVRFSRILRELSKPFLIAANKVDVPEAEENVRALRERYGEAVVPTSAEAELILRRAAAAGLIRYEPGDPEFTVVDEGRLTEAQRRALRLVEERVLDKFGGTGVQEALDRAALKIAGGVVVFPVENETRYTDKDGRVLPDALLLERGATLKDLAYAIHSEIGEKAAFGIDARTKMRLGLDYVLKSGDVIKIVLKK